MSQLQNARFGELLGRMVELTGHDVEEILNEQEVTHRRFGEIALSWGLCQPEHVWHAWASQVSEEGTRIDLDDFGVDSQALAHLSPDEAIRLGMIPVRIVGDQLVVAVADGRPRVPADSLPARLRTNTIYVSADAAQIRQAIETYYGVVLASAGAGAAGNNSPA